MLFLERWRNAVAKDIDVLSLDVWDYTEGPQAVISEEAHLKAFQTVENALSPKALVLIDDVYDTVTFKGKGRLVIPYLLQKGYKPLHLGYQCLFAKDTEYTKEYIAACSSSSGIREDLVNELAQQAYDESVREGTIDLPENFGDLVLQKETEDEEVRMLMAKKREDNVLDADIRWWWNMDDIQRRMIVKIDQKNRGDELRKLVELYGFSEGEAGLVLRKTNPVYGEPGGEEGDDRPLPYELMGRITDYMKTLPAGGMNALKQFPSFNAFIREEFRKGSL